MAHALHFPGAGLRNERDAPLVLASPKEEELAGILAHIEPVKIGALFDRTVSFRYTSSVDSVNGAIECGGRFNPSYRLVRELCGLTDGFGYLYTASNPLPCAVMFCGLDKDDFQSVTVEPTLLVCFTFRCAVQKNSHGVSAALQSYDRQGVAAG